MIVEGAGRVGPDMFSFGFQRTIGPGASLRGSNPGQNNFEEVSKSQSHWRALLVTLLVSTSSSQLSGAPFVAIFTVEAKEVEG